MAVGLIADLAVGADGTGSQAWSRQDELLAELHVGAPPDARSQAHAAQRGYDLSTQRARQLTAGDFEDFDLILAMDWDNLALAEELCPPQHAHKLRRFAEFFQHHNSPVVPDPYQGGARGFEEVLDLVEDGCEGLMQHVRQALDGAG